MSGVRLDGAVPFLWDCGLGCPPVRLHMHPEEAPDGAPAPRLALAVRAHLLGTHSAQEIADYADGDD